MNNFAEKIVVQAKRTSKTVGVKAVQEIVSARLHYGAGKAMVITSSKFSRDAVKLAESTFVDLWDREKLNNELKKTRFL